MAGAQDFSHGARRKAQKLADPFYRSPAWRAVRLQALRRDGYRCIVCGCDVSAPGAARVDHIKPRSTHLELALQLGNLRTLCASCDNQAHREKGRCGAVRDERFVIRGADATGMPLDPGHHWLKA